MNARATAQIHTEFAGVLYPHCARTIQHPDRRRAAWRISGTRGKRHAQEEERRVARRASDARTSRTDAKSAKARASAKARYSPTHVRKLEKTVRELRERIDQLEKDLCAARAARAAPSDSGEARYPVRLPGERTRSGTSATEARTCRREEGGGK